MTVTTTPQPFTMSRPCVRCGGVDGTIAKSGPQNVARCANPSCGGQFVYCPGKAETGEEVRRVRTRDRIDPSTRARILARDNHACTGCGAKAAPENELQVGHMLSVDDAEKLRADGVDVRSTDLDSDHNLTTLCESCNLGMGHRSYFLRTAYFILRNNVERDT